MNLGKWELILKLVGAALAGLISAGTIFGGLSYYVNHKYVPRVEINAYYLGLQLNNKVILEVLQTVGSSFYASTILEVESAIEAYEDISPLTFDQRQQLDLLKKMREDLVRDKKLLENMELDTVDLQNNGSY